MGYLGVDIAKDSLEVATASGTPTRSFPNTGVGIGRLISWLAQRFPQGGTRLVLEPTSTYHCLLVQRLAAEGIPYTLVNPAQTAAYGRLPGRRAKTDRVDAALLASLGESQHPDATPPPGQGQEEAKALGRHLDWLEGEIRRARNRLEAASFSPWTPQAVLDSLQRTIQQLEEEAQQVREEVQCHQRENPEWEEQVQLLASIPGIGEQTARLLLSELPQVDRCSSAGTWVAFCGLNPEPRQSGKGYYSRLCRKGTARVRAGLYLPAVSALRWNPVVRALGCRLRERGKSGRVRVVAAMHKLLRLCFGVLKSRQPFNLSLHQAIS